MLFPYRLQIGFFFEHGIPFIHSNSLVCHKFSTKNSSGSKTEIVNPSDDGKLILEYTDPCFFSTYAKVASQYQKSIKLIENTKKYIGCEVLATSRASCNSSMKQQFFLVGECSKSSQFPQLLYAFVHIKRTPMHIIFQVLVNNIIIFELRASMYFSMINNYTCSGPIICADVVTAPWGSEYSKDLSSFSHTVHRVLSALSSADPARVNCLSKQVAGRGDFGRRS